MASRVWSLLLMLALCGGGVLRAEPEEPQEKEHYVCPDHPKETSDQPGKCKTCGRMLFNPANTTKPNNDGREAEEGERHLDVPLIEYTIFKGGDVGAFHLLVRGKATVPDGVLLSLGLKFHSELYAAFDGQRVEVKEGAFEAAFGPYEKELQAGTYWVECHFLLRSQATPVQRAFMERFKEGERWRAYLEVSLREFLSLQADDFTAQEEARKAHYWELLKRLRELLRVLDEGCAAATALAPDFRHPPGEDADPSTTGKLGWANWLMRERIITDKSAEAVQQKLAQWWDGQRFAAKDGSLDQKAWDDFLAKEFRQPMLESFRKHRDHVGRFRALVYPEEAQNLCTILGALYLLSFDRSDKLYALVGLKREKPEEVDPEANAFSPLDETTIKDIARRIITKMKLLEWVEKPK